MIKQKLYSIIFLSALTCTASLSYADASLDASNSDLPTYTLPTLTVRGQEIANLRPASTFQSVVSNLDFDPRMDFQSRNMAEAQGDINIRGGILKEQAYKSVRQHCLIHKQGIIILSYL